MITLFLLLILFIIWFIGAILSGQIARVHSAKTYPSLNPNDGLPFHCFLSWAMVLLMVAGGDYRGLTMPEGSPKIAIKPYLVDLKKALPQIILLICSLIGIISIIGLSVTLIKK